MRIKVYIVTYNNDEILKKCLALLYRSDLIAYKFSIHIINNYKTLFAKFEEEHNKTTKVSQKNARTAIGDLKKVVTDYRQASVEETKNSQ